ncbi:hypothetical protein F4820DRAFT_433096 [Hypoxylon rubiginosum]|uniref:Uncharacterized protein n=1 Tax=Hypoxylon rubiginosum TaxID=110542 RepID=A0ACB9YRM6_9PEZI|nr:hypothetical protein F4820DRAFT_433096 [Hypoxylon rubiginosum]
MEQPQLSTPTDKSTAVPHTSADRITKAADTTDPTETTAAAESSPPHSLDHLDRLHNSVPSLRFPRPLGNRQLTNWVSSSSPDIMQPENFPDDDPSLAELGYDVIGTDGESQAESTTSSFDYQRPDDVQSLAGTDTGTDVDTNEADTDSSDDEEEELPTIVDAPAASTISDTAVADEDETDDEDADVETLANQSLENPTDFSQHGLPRLGQSGQDQAQESPATVQVSPTRDVTLGDEDIEKMTFFPVQDEPENHRAEGYRLTLRYIQRNRRILVILSGLAIFYSLAIAGKYFLFNPSAPRVLSTVPVASISSAAVPSPIGSSLHTSTSTPTLASTQTQKALQTGTSPSSLVFMPFTKDKGQADIAGQFQQQTICSAKLSDRNGIIVKIPEAVKSTWLSRDAIMIAVSRGLYDIPTKVSSVEEGFLIEVPLDEAHDILAVTIVTTSKPKVKETFHVNFGGNKFTDALDAGKQLVKGFAQKFVDTVNETTAWVEESYIPALDVMSKQVCDQTSSVSDTLRQGIRDAGNAVLGLPTHLTSQVAQLKQSFDNDNMVQRRNQVQLQLVREAQDLRDELALRYVSAQLRSKLWWLRVQGKTEEYQRYLFKAEVYLKERVADAETARKERAERVKTQIRSRRKHERHERHETKGSFWNKGTGAP